MLNICILRLHIFKCFKICEQLSFKVTLGDADG